MVIDTNTISLQRYMDLQQSAPTIKHS